MQCMPVLGEDLSSSSCVRYVREIARWVGPGFHPDTAFTDYVDADGARCFDGEMAARLQREMERAWSALDRAGIDIYAVALAVVRRAVAREYSLLRKRLNS